jgi:hypothetical protein
MVGQSKSGSSPASTFEQPVKKKDCRIYERALESVIVGSWYAKSSSRLSVMTGTSITHVCRMCCQSVYTAQSFFSCLIPLMILPHPSFPGHFDTVSSHPPTVVCVCRDAARSRKDWNLSERGGAVWEGYFAVDCRVCWVLVPDEGAIVLMFSFL